MKPDSLHIRLPAELKSELREEATRFGRTLSQHVQAILSDKNRTLGIYSREVLATLKGVLAYLQASGVESTKLQDLIEKFNPATDQALPEHLDAKAVIGAVDMLREAATLLKNRGRCHKGETAKEFTARALEIERIIIDDSGNDGLEPFLKRLFRL